MAWGGKKLPGGSPGFAVERLELNGVTVDGRFSQSPIAGFYKTQYGDIVLHRVTLLSTPSNTKWGSRIMGHARSLTATECVFLGGGIEHAFYWDNPTGAQAFLHFAGNIAQGWDRTMLQIVTRERPAKDEYVNPGAAIGDCTIEGNVAIDCGGEGGGSAHNFTVTGWPGGTVFFRNNYGESKWGTGLFITYYDQKQGGMLTGSGHQVAKLVWKDNGGVYPKGDRDMNGIGNVGEVILRGGNLSRLALRGPKAAFDIEWNGYPNGALTIESRISPNTWNLQTGQGPFRKGKVSMSPTEVDALWDLEASGQGEVELGVDWGAEGEQPAAGAGD